MQKAILLGLLPLFILLLACSSPSSESSRLYNLQTSCGNSARDWFSKLHGRDTRDAPEAFETFDFANHYNQKSGRCYLIWNESHSGTGGFISQNLVDVNQNAAIGFYMQGLHDEKHTRCEVEGKRCQSSEEWTALLAPYLHE